MQLNDIIWGMPTLIELEGIEANANLCKSLGLGFIELNMNLPEYQPDRIDIEKLVYIQEKSNIFYTLHLPEEFDIANFNENVRNVYVRIFKDSVKIAKILNAPIINVHMNLGVYFTMPESKIYLYRKYFNDYINNIKKFGAYSDELLRETDIKLCIENTGIYNMDFITDAVDILLQNDRIFLTWDIGHDHSGGNNDRKYIMDNIDKLKHMHFHDAKANKNHLPLFTGDIDICEKIRIAKKHGCICVIETKTVEALKESVDKLMAYS